MQNTTHIGFSDNATAGLDSGYDTVVGWATVLSLYSHLEDGTQQLGIQSRKLLKAVLKSTPSIFLVSWKESGSIPFPSPILKELTFQKLQCI